MKSHRKLCLCLLHALAAGSSDRNVLNQAGEDESRLLRLAAQQLDVDFSKIRQLAAAFAARARLIYENQSRLCSGFRKSKHTSTAEKLMYELADDDGAASASTGLAALQSLLRKTRFTAYPDLLMIPLVRTSPEIVQAFFNDRESIAHIYSYFDVVDMFKPGLDIAGFNFFISMMRSTIRQKNRYRIYAAPVNDLGWSLWQIAPEQPAGASFRFFCS